MFISCKTAWIESQSPAYGYDDLKDVKYLNLYTNIHAYFICIYSYILIYRIFHMSEIFGPIFLFDKVMKDYVSTLWKLLT